MKKDIVEYVSKCLICQKVKAEHIYLARELQLIKLLEWKWYQITINFVMGFPRIIEAYDTF